jgi:ATP-binding cassette subfamily F protein 3
VIFVSHDRYFIDGLGQKVFEVERNQEDPSRGSQVHVYPGNYEDYLWRKEGGAQALASATTAAAKPLVEAVAIASPEPVAAEKVRRVNPIKLRQMQERLAAVEAEIPRIEGWVAEAEQALGVYVSPEETQRLSEVLAVLREQQASLNIEWEELSMQLEEN